jgi:phage shock protein PspC (stress-responsive transcriptional regulator)
MNKTVTVNIGGIVFHIDENAYERFKQYLESIRAHFTASDGRDEIMQDIESRIAEIFQDRIRDQKQVITLSDVEEVTQMMGKPEQFGDEESREKETEKNTADVKVKRRLFRNPDDRLLGGVCSGISSFFDLDPIWIRLAFAFALFFYGSGFLLYLILWIVIPKARTTTDKLQMKGEPVNISNIEKNVQEEIANVKKSFEDVSKGKHAQNILTRILDGIIQVFKFIFVFIGKLFAIFFIFIGLLVAFVMFAAVFAVLKVPGVQYPEIINQVLPAGFQFGIALIAAMFVVGIPF